MDRRKIRWSLAAHDICFTNSWHSYFFMLGKCIPVIRGGGVYQEAMDFCIEKLAAGEWIHVFPEGKVNMFKETMRFAIFFSLYLFHISFYLFFLNLFFLFFFVYLFFFDKNSICFIVFRLKWGIGRLIYESPIPPLVVPIYHLGMDDVLPNEPPYRLKIRKKVTMNYGDPIDFSELIEELRVSKVSEEEARKAITDRIQTELLKYCYLKSQYS